jgi:hypothetical protein
LLAAVGCCWLLLAAVGCCWRVHWFFEQMMFRGFSRGTSSKSNLISVRKNMEKSAS